jgi:spore maturation protein CgeB
VDQEVFRPGPPVEEFQFDVAYVGNNIKGEELARRYLLPATDFNFGLFGNWRIPADDPTPNIFRLGRRLRHRRAIRNTPPVFNTLRAFSRGSIANHLTPQLYRSCRIILNTTGDDSRDCGVITLRTFEVLACRGFLITDFAPPEIQNCVVVSTGGADLREKIAFYLAHPEARNEIAANGYEYAQKFGLMRQRAASLRLYLTQVLTG